VTIINTYFKSVMSCDKKFKMTKEAFDIHKEKYAFDLLKRGQRFAMPEKNWLRSMVWIYGKSGLYPRTHFPTYVCGKRWMKLMKFNGCYSLISGVEGEDHVVAIFDRTTTRWTKFHIVKRSFSEVISRHLLEKCVNIEHIKGLSDLWLKWKKKPKGYSFPAWLKEFESNRIKHLFSTTKSHKMRMG